MQSLIKINILLININIRYLFPVIIILVIDTCLNVDYLFVAIYKLLCIKYSKYCWAVDPFTQITTAFLNKSSKF